MMRSVGRERTLRGGAGKSEGITEIFGTKRGKMEGEKIDLKKMIGFEKGFTVRYEKLGEVWGP